MFFSGETEREATLTICHGHAPVTMTKCELHESEQALFSLLISGPGVFTPSTGLINVSTTCPCSFYLCRCSMYCQQHCLCSFPHVCSGSAVTFNVEQEA